MSNFYLPSTSASAQSTPSKALSPRQYSPDYEDDLDEDDLDTLPYPTELVRKDFLAPDFDAQVYLSSLRNRHQTLEDLRGDLRRRSQLLSQELLDLVNSNYEEFLSLGKDLQGGEEKVEGIRVGVLGFEREVLGIQRGLRQRLEDTNQLLETKRDLRKDVMFGRRLLEVHEHISELENRLGLDSDANAGSDVDPDDYDDDDDEEEGEEEAGVIGMDGSDDASITKNLSSTNKQTRRLQRLVDQFVIAKSLAQRTGLDHPFIKSQISRLDEIRKTLLLDIAVGLKAAKATSDGSTILIVLAMYRDLGAHPNSTKLSTVK